ncbi:MAG: hypothetical protein KF745_08850 [Phycisphaeraceae bacterium]|nr:hypothetical protein [Phycisphaeraceae bacterium]
MLTQYEHTGSPPDRKGKTRNHPPHPPLPRAPRRPGRLAPDRLADDPGSDARYHVRTSAETLVDRSEFLPVDEAALIRAVYGEGVAMTMLARAAGLPVAMIRRRIKKIVRRLLTDEFAFVATHLAQWPPITRRIARCCVLHGRTLRSAALELGLTVHVVRRHRDMVLTLAAGSVAA